ncbi:MAG: sodium:proton antiporter [Lachnospiraceae bacterium]|jgi:formate hydrogenlyase subunit 3/multisubunit Na+/H+ antiporter MnhD subunit|nr:sodium:proton antiporter [Lachnospiraceae bacterium]
MDFIQNFPFFSILLSLGSGVLTSIMGRKTARLWNTFILVVITVLSAVLFVYMIGDGEPYTFMMGHFPAPWGNEIRAGVLEAGMALFFCLVMLFSLKGGQEHIDAEVEDTKVNLYYIMINLLLSSLLALIYTNDLFTAYVFVEINTISACGLIMITQSGRTIEAATRYMIMASLGSGLLLMGLCILYDITGHLLMSNIKDSIAYVYAQGTYNIPLIASIGMVVVGLAIKSALYPFHTWLPDAYGYSTVSSAAILSSLVSKGYIFLLIKIFFRVVGFEIIVDSKIVNILFVFGLLGMIMGSVNAILENDIRRMIAFSSVAQIGYIYMGLGLGTTIGIVASIFHILSHASTKSLLFIAGVGLTDASGGSKKFEDLTGSGYRNPAAGVAFVIGACSMVGIPLFSGFISKVQFAEAAVQNSLAKMLPTLICLAISTVLNAIYFMKTVIRLYTPASKRTKKTQAGEAAMVGLREHPLYNVTLLCMVILNMILGCCSQPIVDWITSGLAMFG